MYECKCCGCLTIEEKYDICPVCRWEHDPYQEKYPDHAGGANDVSLIQAKENYLRFGVCDERLAEFAREPFPQEISMKE